MTRLLSLMLIVLLAHPALADKQAAGTFAKDMANKLAPGDRVVSIYTWEYFIPDEILAAFEAASGIDVVYTTFSSNEEMLLNLYAERGRFDLLICSDYMVDIMRGEDGMEYAETIDRRRLPNYENIDAVFQGWYFDPADVISIPYAYTVPLIVYDPEQVDFEVTACADLWRDDFRNGLVVFDDMRNVIGMAQRKLGLSVNETDPSNMTAAAAELEALRANIALYNTDTPYEAMIGGAMAGFMHGMQVVAAQLAEPSLAAVFPSEGIGFSLDCMVLAGGAPHMDAAYILVNYLLDGEVSANISELIYYGSCNAAAWEYLSEAYTGIEALNPPRELLESAEMICPLPADVQALYDGIWNHMRR